MVLRKGEFILTEKYEVKDSDRGVIIEGLALPLGKPSRNRYLYTKESVQRAYKTLEGKPILFNHDENRVLGHVEAVWLEDTGLYYRANLDPEERDIIRKLKRGDINKVSIQAIVENLQPEKDYIRADVKEFLELSVVTIPGFEDTTLELKEKLLKEQREIDMVAATMRALRIDAGFVVEDSQANEERTKVYLKARKKIAEPYYLWVEVKREYSEGKDKVWAKAWITKGDSSGDVAQSFGEKSGTIAEVKDWLGDVKKEAEDWVKERKTEEKLLREGRVQEVDKRYQNPDGTFKKMKCPDSDNESKFCGCVRYMMNVKGLGLENAKKLCAYIKQRKYGAKFSPDLLKRDSNIKAIVEFLTEVENMRLKEQEGADNPTDEKNEVLELLKNIQAKLNELDARLTAVEEEVKKQKAEQPKAEEPSEGEASEKAHRRTVVLGSGPAKDVVTISEIFRALRG